MGGSRQAAFDGSISRPKAKKENRDHRTAAIGTLILESAVSEARHLRVVVCRLVVSRTRGFAQVAPWRAGGLQGARGKTDIAAEST